MMPLSSSCSAECSRTFFSFSGSSLFSENDGGKTTASPEKEASRDSLPEKKTSAVSPKPDTPRTGDAPADTPTPCLGVHTPEATPGSSDRPTREASVVEEKEGSHSQETAEALRLKEKDSEKNLVEESFLSPSGYEGPEEGSYRTALLGRIKEAVRREQKKECSFLSEKKGGCSTCLGYVSTTLLM